MSATKFIDFTELKTRVSIEQCVALLGLKMQQQGLAFRSACPACKTGGDRALVVTPSKGLFYCHAAKRGGDQIALVSHIRDIGAKESAAHIAEQYGTGTGTVTSTVAKPAPNAPEKRRQGFDAEAYAKSLDAAHVALEPLGVSQEALEAFKAGYSSSGVNRGRLAVAVCDKDGAVLGFCGRALKDEQPALIVPNGLDLAHIIFNVHRAEGEVRMVRDVVEVMRCHDLGETAICFLTDLIEPQQHEMLASLQDQKQFKVFY